MKTKRKSAKIDMVNHPKHYNNFKIEVIEVIEDWRLGFNDGNAVKYIGRAPYKGTEILDIQKAIWYLNRHLKNLKIKEEAEKRMCRKRRNKNGKKSSKKTK